MNVAMGHLHEEDEGGPNRVVGEEEAVDEIGIEEGIGTGIGEIGRGILVGRREVGGGVVLGGVNALGHENSPKSQFRLFVCFLKIGAIVRPAKQTESGS